MRNFAYALGWATIAGLCCVARYLLAALPVLFVCTFLFGVSNRAHADDYYWWRTNPHQLNLLDYDRPAGQRQIGAYDIGTGLYTPLIDGAWGRPCKCPAELPAWCPRPRPQLPTGVIVDKLPQKEGVWRNGEKITKGQALNLLGAKPMIGEEGDPKIPDDRSKPRVTVIGSKQACAGPMAIAKQHGEFVSVDYRPDAWMIQRQGFVVAHDPTIYIQDKTGGVLRRLDGYLGDADFETVLNEVSRKIGPDPNYNGANDEGWLPKLRPLIPRVTANIPWLPIATIAGLVLFAFYRRKQKL